jgi:hypothetical protein
MAGNARVEYAPKKIRPPTEDQCKCSNTPEFIQQYDYIIAGAGCADSALLFT